MRRTRFCFHPAYSRARSRSILQEAFREAPVPSPVSVARLSSGDRAEFLDLLLDIRFENHPDARLSNCEGSNPPEASPAFVRSEPQPHTDSSSETALELEKQYFDYRE